MRPCLKKRYNEYKYICTKCHKTGTTDHKGAHRPDWITVGTFTTQPSSMEDDIDQKDQQILYTDKLASCEHKGLK